MAFALNQWRAFKANATASSPRGGLEPALIVSSFSPDQEVDMDGFVFPVASTSLESLRTSFTLSSAKGSFGSFPATCAYPGRAMIQLGFGGLTLWMPRALQPPLVQAIVDDLAGRGFVQAAHPLGPGVLSRAHLVSGRDLARVSGRVCTS